MPHWGTHRVPPSHQAGFKVAYPRYTGKEERKRGEDRERNGWDKRNRKKWRQKEKRRGGEGKKDEALN